MHCRSVAIRLCHYYLGVYLQSWSSIRGLMGSTHPGPSVPHHPPSNTPTVRQQRHRAARAAPRRTVTQQEAEGGSEPDRILHEGRGQGEPGSPGFSSLHRHYSSPRAPEPEQGAALPPGGCPDMRVRAHPSTGPEPGRIQPFRNKKQEAKTEQRRLT